MRNLKRVLAVLLALTMLLGLAACGDNKTSPTGTTAPTQSGAKDTPTPAPATPTPTPAPLHITVYLPSDQEHVAVAGENDKEMEYYNKLVAEINEYTNMDVEWQ